MCNRNQATIHINRGESLPVPKVSRFVRQALKQLQELERAYRHAEEMERARRQIEQSEMVYRAYLLADLALEAKKALLSLIVGTIAVMVISNIKIQSLTIARQRTSWQVSGRGKVNND